MTACSRHTTNALDDDAASSSTLV